MSRRLKYPEGSIYNLIENPRHRRRFNSRRWSWYIFTIRKSAPGFIFLLVLVAVAVSALRAG